MTRDALINSAASFSPQIPRQARPSLYPASFLYIDSASAPHRQQRIFPAGQQSQARVERV